MSNIRKGFVWNKGAIQCWIVHSGISYHLLSINMHYNLPLSWENTEMEVLLQTVERYLDKGSVNGC